MTKSKNDKRCILCNKPYDYKYEMFGRDRKYIKQGNKFSVFFLVFVKMNKQDFLYH